MSIQIAIDALEVAVRREAADRFAAATAACGYGNPMIPGMRCDRPRGHKDEHEACDEDGGLLASWRMHWEPMACGGMCRLPSGHSGPCLCPGDGDEPGSCPA